MCTLLPHSFAWPSSLVRVSPSCPDGYRPACVRVPGGHLGNHGGRALPALASSDWALPALSCPAVTPPRLRPDDGCVPQRLRPASSCASVGRVPLGWG